MALRGSQHEPLHSVCPAGRSAPGETRGDHAGLLGPLGAEPHISVVWLFVDPVANLAVLGPVDDEEDYDEVQAYDELVEPLDPLPLGSLAFTAENEAWMLALDGRWFRCRVSSLGRTLWISEAQDDIRRGMSGSPIMLSSGHAVGVVSISREVPGAAGSEGGPNPLLAAQLPCWLAGGLLEIPLRAC